MAKKGIEEMISEIEIFIDNCKYKPLCFWQCWCHWGSFSGGEVFP